MEININLPDIVLVDNIKSENDIDFIIEEILNNDNIDDIKENIKKVKDK